MGGKNRYAIHQLMILLHDQVGQCLYFNWFSIYAFLRYYFENSVFVMILFHFISFDET